MSILEKAAINVFERHFPGCTKGCYFHLQQSLHRKVGELGLKRLYEAANGKFAISVRCIASLAFLPEEEVSECYYQMINHSDFDIRALPVAEYFEDTYIGHPTRNRTTRNPPLFPIRFWSVHGRTLDGRHRTNNLVEGWHRRFQSVLGCFRPCVFRCIQAIIKEQGMVSH